MADKLIPEELIDRYGRYYWMIREMLSRPPRQK
jgi:hypothetical protein